MASKMKKIGAEEEKVRAATATTDKVAYKECVTQQKRQNSSNPWAICNSQFGMRKDDGFSIEAGMSYAMLQKKEAKVQKEIRTEKVKEVAPNVHMKKPKQPPKTNQKMIHKTDFDSILSFESPVGKSWNHLKKMQTEEPLNKKPSKK